MNFLNYLLCLIFSIATLASPVAKESQMQKRGSCGVNKTAACVKCGLVVFYCEAKYDKMDDIDKCALDNILCQPPLNCYRDCYK